MESNRNAIQLIGLIMSKQTLDVNSILDLVQILNKSASSCRDTVTILQDIFKHQKSGRILIAVQTLQYFVKNCNLTFHKAANKQSFQKKLLSLLNRIRGKTNLIKQLNSNTDNWCRIQAKVLYIIQLWYDAFMLEENLYSHIINSYKILRKQNITFPPRSKNQKNLMLVQTQSPIFDNIQQIAYEDQRKFNKKLNAMGMGHLKSKMEKNVEKVQSMVRVQKKAPLTKQVNIDEISQKIGVIQSTQVCTLETLKVIQQIKKAIEHGKVKPNEEAYWKDIKKAAEQLVENWQQKNAQLIQSQEQKYLEKKLGMMGMNKNSSNSQSDQHVVQNIRAPKSQIQEIDLLDVIGQMHVEPQKIVSQNCPVNVVNNGNNGEFNLLDL